MPSAPPDTAPLAVIVTEPSVVLAVMPSPLVPPVTVPEVVIVISPPLAVYA